MPNRYWVGGSGTWDSSSTHWSTSSGGASGATPPSSVDSAIFDQAGTYTVTLGATAALACLDWTVSAGTVTFAGTMTSGNFYIYGSIDLKAGTVCSFSIPSTQFLIRGSGSRTIKTNGTAFTGTTTLRFYCTSSTGLTFTLLDALTCYAVDLYTLSTGSTELNLNGFTLTTSAVSSPSAFYMNNNTTLNFGTGGILLITGNGATFNVAPGASITTTGTGTIRFNNNSTFYGQSKVFTGVTLSNGGSGTNISINGSNTFNGIENAAQPCLFTFYPGTTTTITNFNVNGTAGNLVTLRSGSPGTQFSIAKASGTVTANYLSIKDSAATGGASWNANNSTDAGNNSGWTINGVGGSVTLVLTNTNLSATGAVGNITIAGDQTIFVSNTGLGMTGAVGNVSLFIGTGVIVGLSGVSSTGRVGSVTTIIIQNASVTLTGLYATGVVSNTPLNIWISVNTNQTANWIPIAT